LVAARVEVALSDGRRCSKGDLFVLEGGGGTVTWGGKVTGTIAAVPPECIPVIDVVVLQRTTA
jgi:hypothetical protein